MSNIDQREGVPLFTFEHTHNQTTGLVEVRKKVTYREGDTEHVRLVIKGRGQQLGEIKGVIRRLRDIGQVFEASTSINRQTINEEEEPLRRVIGASIAEIVRREVVGTWHSSRKLSLEGEDMYGRYMKRFGDLEVRGDFPGYTITRRAS